MTPPSVQVPVDLLLRLYEAAPADLRAEMEAYLASYKEKVDSKGHVAEGFRRIGNEMVFDLALYEEAVYRGKLQTYGKNARDQMRALKHSIDMLQDFAEEQGKIAGQLPAGALDQRVGRGHSISEEDRKLLARLRPLLGSGDEQER